MQKISVKLKKNYWGENQTGKRDFVIIFLIIEIVQSIKLLNNLDGFQIYDCICMFN